MKPDWSFANERLLICGPSGCGKTTLALSFLATHLARRCQLFAFDQKGELATRLGVPACHTQQAVAMSSCTGQPVVFNPHSVFAGNTAAGFHFLAGAAWNVARVSPSEVVLLVDELQDFTGPNRGDIPPPLASCVESGRGWKIHTLAIAQSANLVNARLRQQFNRVAVFRQSETTAVDPLRSWGFDPEAVAALAPGAFILRNRDTGETRPGDITWRSNLPQVRLRPAAALA